MEHLHGLSLIALTVGKELIELNARLFLVCDEPCALETLGARLRSNQRGQIDELPCLQGDKLVARLAGLKDAEGRLAR